jgi:hypothetical protein
MIIISVLGLLICGVLIVLGYKLVRERYTLLRHVGKFPSGLPYQNITNKPIAKKFLRHKYSKGTAYDRAKLRKNRFQKNYVV